MKLQSINHIPKSNMCSFTGSKLVPRYLYHLTSEANLQKIMHDGYLIPQKADSSGANIFMIELNNFVSKWHKIVYDFNIAQGLSRIGNPDNQQLFFNMDKLMKQLGCTKEFVQSIYPNNLMQALLSKTNPMNLGRTCVLRIPTKKLDMDNLFVRDQLASNNFTNTAEYRNIIENFLKYMQNEGKQKLFANGRIPTQEDIANFMDTEFIKFLPEKATKLVLGDSAKNSKLHKMRGEAIEYLYRDPISTNDIEVAGMVDLKSAMKTAVHSEKPYSKLFEMMFDAKGEKLATQQIPV